MKKRIILFLARWYESIDKPMPRWIERACDKDISLGLDLDDERELTRSLRDAPEWNPVKPNPYLAERIIACLDDKERPEAPKSTAWKEISIGIAACITIAVACQWVGTSNQEGAPIVADNPAVEEGNLFANTKLLANNSDWKNPLDQEIEYVIGDAQGAIDFLAKSFVPTSLRKQGSREG